MIYRLSTERKASWSTDSNSAKPTTFEALEPRILLSGDSLLNIAPDPLQDALLDAMPQIVQEADLLHAGNQIEEEINQELDPSDTINAGIYKPIYTLLVEDGETNDDVAPVQVDNDVADLSDESDGNVDNKITLAEAVTVTADEPVSDSSIVNDDGSMPLYECDTDLSIEYATSIEIRGPPLSESVNNILSDYAVQMQPELTTQASVDLPGLYLVDLNTDFNGQVVYFDFDGETDVTYNGPVIVEGINIPEFSTDVAGLAGQESIIISQIISALEQQFEGTGVLFTTTKPDSGTSYSTIFVGGDDSDFAEYGSFFGLAEQVDVGNQDQTDNGFVFSDNIVDRYSEKDLLVTNLADLISHETGHLLGYSHDNEDPNGDVLSMLAADFTPVGPEIFVNTSTYWSQYNPEIASDDNGNFVITWTGLDIETAGSESSGVFAQRFSSTGQRLGGEFKVNTTISGNQGYSRIAMGQAGNFVVTWSGKGLGDIDGIFAQRYNASGLAQGSEFLVNSTTEGEQSLSDIAMDANGNFVICWIMDDGYGESLYAKRFAANGSVLNNEFKVNTLEHEWLSGTVSIAPNGAFVIGLCDDLTSSNNVGVFARLYNSSGAPQGDEFFVSKGEYPYWDYSIVRMQSNGNFTVFMAQNGTNGSIYARQYNANGTAIAADFSLGITGFVNGMSADVADDGSFVVTWFDAYSVPGNNIYARRYFSDGSPQENAFRVNTTAGSSEGPDVSIDPNGQLVFVWQRTGSSPTYADVFAQRFAESDITPPGNVTNLQASPGDEQVDLSWTKPGDSDLSGILIVRRAGGTPQAGPVNGASYSVGSSIGGGTVIYNANGTNYQDTNVTNGTTYYYEAWAYDTSLNYSGMHDSANATPSDQPPGPVTNLQASPGDEQVDLSWTKPGDSDLSGILIVRRAGGTPQAGPVNGASYSVGSSIGGGTVIYNANGTSYLDTNVINGTAYYYEAWAYDTSLNYSGMHDSASATPYNLPQVVLVVPGILGSQPIGYYSDWLSFSTIGVAPSNLKLDYFCNSYDNLVATLKQGEASGETKVFEAPYDWRDSIDGPQSLSDVDITAPDTCVEYLVYWVNEAAQWWLDQDYDSSLFKVDIVAHSMGGLVAREMIQSSWYTQLVNLSNLVIPVADFVDDLIMLDTPNHGSVDAYKYSTWLNQIPGIAKAGTDFVFDKITKFAASAAGIPPFLAGAVVDGIRVAVGLDSDSIQANVKTYVDKWMNGLLDMLPTWDCDVIVTPPANGFLALLNGVSGLNNLASRADAWNFTGYLSKANTTFSTATFEIDWDLFDIHLEPLALAQGNKAYGTGAILYSLGDPLTKTGTYINGYGAYLNASGIHNGTSGLAGFTGQSTNGMFTTFRSHQLFGDDANVTKATLAACGINGLNPIHPFETYDGVLEAATAKVVDWVKAGVSKLEDVVKSSWEKFTNWLVFWDPANVVVTDAGGNRIGGNGTQTFNEIPGAAYMSDGINGMIVLPASYSTGRLTGIDVRAYGTGGIYNGWVASSDSDQVSGYTLGGETLALGQVEQSIIVRVGSQSAKSVIYMDEDGSIITVSMTNGSSLLMFSGSDLTQTLLNGVVTVSGSNLRLDSVEIANSTATSSLTITVKGGDGLTTIDHIFGSLPVGALKASTADLSGDGIEMTGDGCIVSIQLHDLIDGSDIIMPGTGAAKGITISVASISDGSDINLGSGLKSLTATEWLGGSLIAPWASSISIKGNSRAGISGDFGANVTLTGADSKGIALNKLTVAGKITDSDIIAQNGYVGTVTAAQWDSGSLNTTWLKSLTIKGRKANATYGIDALPGDFGADVILTGADLKGVSLNRAKIAGQITGGLWDIEGDVVSIKALSTDLNWELDAEGFVKTLSTTAGLAGATSAEWFGSILTKGSLTALITTDGVDIKGFSIVKLQAGSVGNLPLNVPGGINTIKVYEWEDGGIQSAWIGTLQTLGNSKAGISGDFGADVTLTGADAKGIALNKLTVAGKITDSDIIAQNGYVGTVTAAQWDSGSLNTTWLKSLTIKGRKANATYGIDALPGDFGADVTLTGADLKGVSLNRAKIAGQITGGTWLIAGNVGSIQIGSSEAGWMANFSGDVTSLIAKGYTDINGNKFLGNLSGTWVSKSLKSVSVTGNIVNANMTLMQTPDPKLLALGTMTVKGWIDGSTITSSGNIGKLSAGAIRNSSCFVGEITGADDGNGDGVLDLPNPVIPDELGDATINVLTVKGITGENYSIINSNIAASRFNSIYVTNPKYDNAGVEFGVAADFIGKVTIKDADGSITLTNLSEPSDSMTTVNAIILLI